MLDDARREGLIASNPAADVDLPRVPPGRELFLTKSEVAAVVAVVTEPYATVIHTLAYTGLRWGELAGLKVDQLDLLRGRLRVDGVMTRYGPKAYPKGGKRRTVPLPGHLVDALAAHLTRYPAERDALVFTGPRGGVLQDGNVRERHWMPALATAKIAKDAHIHDLRHSFASWLVQDGVPLIVVQRLLGHESSRTSERYSHLAPDNDYGVLRSLESADVPISDVHNLAT
jgi:integrase